MERVAIEISGGTTDRTSRRCWVWGSKTDRPSRPGRQGSTSKGRWNASGRPRFFLISQLKVQKRMIAKIGCRNLSIQKIWMLEWDEFSWFLPAGCWLPYGATWRWQTRGPLRKWWSCPGRLWGSQASCFKLQFKFQLCDIIEIHWYYSRKGEIVLDGMILEGDWKADRGRQLSFAQQAARFARLTAGHQSSPGRHLNRRNLERTSWRWSLEALAWKH